jgi:hypothetical protein
MKARTAFWLAFAVWIAAVAMPMGVHAQPAPPPIVKAPALPPDVAFGRFIALIRGHLLTGDGLVAQREWDVASRHFGFPREEIYGVIREDLRGYRTPPFDEALKTLVRTVKARNAKQFAKAREKVEVALAAADAGLKARQQDWPRFTVAVAMAVLKTAPDEYDDAVAKGRIVRPIGYQTARGFILQADRMVESAAAELSPDNAAALGTIRAGFAEFKQAFPSVNAPKQPLMDPATMLDVIARIDAASAKLM